MRRFMFVLGAFLALVIVASPADAQLKFGIHGDYIAGGFSDLEDISGGDFDLAGDFGAGVRVAISPPALPFQIYGDGTYFFPSCEAGDCSYWTAGIGAQLGLPLPMLRPYILGGWQWKSFDLSVTGFESSTENNPFFGVGAELNVLGGLYLEGQWEFPDDVESLTETLSITPFVLKVGLNFG